MNFATCSHCFLLPRAPREEIIDAEPETDIVAVAIALAEKGAQKRLRPRIVAISAEKHAPRHFRRGFNIEGETGAAGHR